MKKRYGLISRVVSPERGKEEKSLRWEGFVRKGRFKPGMKKEESYGRESTQQGDVTGVGRGESELGRLG